MAFPQTQDEAVDDGMVMREIGFLRDLVNLKLGNFESWLSKLTVAVEKLAENRDRTIVLETRMAGVDKQLKDHDQQLDKLTEKQNDIDKQVTKHAVIIGAIVGGVNLVIILVLKILGIS